jgi:hypothetical protein
MQYLGIDWSYRKRNEHPSNPGSTQPDQHPKGDLTTPTPSKRKGGAATAWWAPGPYGSWSPASGTRVLLRLTFGAA